MILGNKIKAYLERNGIKYSFVSSKTGIPMKILSPMLNEKSEIKKTVPRIFDLLSKRIQRRFYNEDAHHRHWDSNSK